MNKTCPTFFYYARNGVFFGQYIIVDWNQPRMEAGRTAASENLANISAEPEVS